MPVAMVAAAPQKAAATEERLLHDELLSQLTLSCAGAVGRNITVTTVVL